MGKVKEEHSKDDTPRDIARNKKAFFDYEIIEKYEAGIALVGTEVKSLRAGSVTMKDSFAVFKGNELYLVNLHISPYEFGNLSNHDPERSRKLLLHRHELNKLTGRIKERGYSMVPLSLYFKDNKIKVSIGLVRGKKQYDKRDSIKKRDMDRDMERDIKG
ncbi:MAG: SsrA-binding protein SmpB [Spirochaetes bacterium]|nr:SsrA-binding protein SmpB [Spirochaetota bacterium]